MSARSVFLNEHIEIRSHNEYKRALLTGYLSFISFGIGTFYLVYDYFNGLKDSNIYYVLLLLSGFLSWMLNREGKHFIAKTILLMTGYLVIFLSSSMTSLETNSHLFYLVICLGAYALFGYEDRVIALIFSFFSLVGFLTSFVFGISLFQQVHYSQEYIRSNQIINFLCVTITTSLILYILVKENYQSEETLKEKQQKIESQNQCLSKANAELDQFVYSASHDLRSPLTSILGLVNIAKRSENPREIIRCLDMIHSRVHRLDDLIKDIVSFSRNSRIDINKHPVDLRHTVNEILEDFNTEEYKHAIDFQVNIPTGLSIDTDAARLKIILRNLIGNSIKHHDKRNPNPFVSVKFKGSKDGLNAIVVSDNGPGIALEYQSKIFDMFYRANDRAEGSGLGLYIVKETIAKLSGSILLESAPGKGAVFTVSLPI